MPDNVFFYNKSIDIKVAKAIGDIFNSEVLQVIKMQHGEVNHVYNVVTKKQNLLVRVFRTKNWPEDGMLQWIEKKLTQHNIPHAKILYFSRSKKYFPHGFMVTEFIEGYNGELAVDNGSLSFAQAYFNIGKVLKDVHKIKALRFGPVKNGRGQFTNFVDYALKGDLLSNYKKLSKHRQMSEELFNYSRLKVKNLLLEFAGRFKPVLNHGDPNRQNAIWTSKQQWVLIDWDNASFSTWIEDFADLTYWLDYKTTEKEGLRRKKVFVKNFFAGYGKTDFNLAEIYKIEQAMHIIKCFRLCIFYYFVKKDKQGLARTRKKLQRLLK